MIHHDDIDRNLFRLQAQSQDLFERGEQRRDTVCIGGIGAQIVSGEAQFEIVDAGMPVLSTTVSPKLRAMSPARSAIDDFFAVRVTTRPPLRLVPDGPPGSTGFSLKPPFATKSA